MKWVVSISFIRDMVSTLPKSSQLSLLAIGDLNRGNLVIAHNFENLNMYRRNSSVEVEVAKKNCLNFKESYLRPDATVKDKISNILSFKTGSISQP